ncbi:MAG: hypothetical protein Q8R79_05385 [Legionellaceae bacterium]|nr:hypothetical protein [Legionellaceae bacterium]
MAFLHFKTLLRHRDFCYFYCSFGLGLRAKEIASLKIADVTTPDYKLLDEVCLKRAMTKGEKQRYAYLTHKKVCDAYPVCGH